MASTNVDIENVHSEKWDFGLEEGEYQTKELPVDENEDDEIFNFQEILEQLTTIDDDGKELGLFESTRMKNQDLVAILIEDEVQLLNEKNELLRSCPSPTCTNSVFLVSPYVDLLMPMTISCLCGHEFCYSCFKAPHDPIPCALLDKWYDKQALRCDETDSYWATTTTVSCPFCLNGIEIPKDTDKIIACPNTDCDQKVCWECLQSHPYDQDCVEPKIGKNSIPVENDDSRFFKYESLFYEQQKQLQLESEFLQQQEELKNFKEKEVTWINMTQAFDILHDCRETVMFSTALSFFLKPHSMGKIFEQNVQNLLEETEKLKAVLHGYIKGGSDKLDTVITISKYCNGRRLAILDHAIEGFQQEGGYWKIREEE